jgi:hypothetical protein
MQYGPKIVTNGLVFYVNAADKASFSGSGSNNWKDISATSVSGASALKGSPSFNASNGGYLTTGAYNSGKYFDWGTNISAVNFTSSNFTIMVMFLPNSSNFTGGHIGLFSYCGAGYSVGYSMVLSKGEYNKISFFTNNSPNQQETRSSDFSVYSGKWVFLNVVRNGTSVRIYVNNVDITQTAGTHSNPTSNTTHQLVLAGDTQAGVVGNTWDGNFASFGMYNRALSASELTQNFNAVRSRFGI